MGIHHRQAKALETIAEEMRHIRKLFQKMTGETIEKKSDEQKPPADTDGEYWEKHLDENGDFFTDKRFWDCNCIERYIHHKTEARCVTCGATRGKQPDSRIDEVIGAICDGYLSVRGVIINGNI